MLRKRREREDAILDAARNLLITKGYEAMTLQDIIAEIGISKPTLYRHFSSKESLGVHVLLRAIGHAREHLKLLEQTLPAGDALRAMIDWSLESRFGFGGGDFSSALPLFGHPSTRAAERDLIAALASLILKAKRDGSIECIAAPIVVAQALHSIAKDTSFDRAPAIRTDVAKLLLGS